MRRFVAMANTARHLHANCCYTRILMGSPHTHSSAVTRTDNDGILLLFSALPLLNVQEWQIWIVLILYDTKNSAYQRINTMWKCVRKMTWPHLLSLSSNQSFCRVLLALLYSSRFIAWFRQLIALYNQFYCAFRRKAWLLCAWSIGCRCFFFYCCCCFTHRSRSAWTKMSIKFEGMVQRSFQTTIVLNHNEHVNR